MPWGNYPPVAGEAQVGDTITGVHQLTVADPGRVWVVLLRGGFRTRDDHGAIPTHAAREYVETDQLYFGRYLKLGLFEHG
jgi:hypothetical protein